MTIKRAYLLISLEVVRNGRVVGRRLMAKAVIIVGKIILEVHDDLMRVVVTLVLVLLLAILLGLLPHLLAVVKSVIIEKIIVSAG